MDAQADLPALFQQLHHHYGPQQWWPAESPFEVMVGAILTQNTAWERVEEAIANLRSQNMLSLEAIVAMDQEALAQLIRPSGYFNLKAKRLQSYCRWYLEHEARLWKSDTASLRKELLGVHGVGPETADDILLYAFQRPVFVVDAYTRRVLQRLGWSSGEESYEEIRLWVEKAFSGEEEQSRTGRFNELHALIVVHAKEHCRKPPRCDGCPLSCGFVVEPWPR